MGKVISGAELRAVDKKFARKFKTILRRNGNKATAQVTRRAVKQLKPQIPKGPNKTKTQKMRHSAYGSMRKVKATNIQKTTYSRSKRAGWFTVWGVDFKQAFWSWFIEQGTEARTTGRRINRTTVVTMERSHYKPANRGTVPEWGAVKKTVEKQAQLYGRLLKGSFNRAWKQTQAVLKQVA